MTLTVSESHGSVVVEPMKSAERIQKPEIRDLSVTLNEDKEDVRTDFELLFALCVVPFS